VNGSAVLVYVLGMRTPLQSLLPAAAALAIFSACAPTRPVAVPTPAPLPAVSAAPATRVPAVERVIDAPPAAVGMDPGLNARLDSIVGAALDSGISPGAALVVARYGRVVHQKGYGRVDWDPSARPVDSTTMFDMASLTKVVATTTAAMILEEEGKLRLDSTVAYYLPQFGAVDSAKRAITVRMLVEHRGGLEAFAQLFKTFRGREQYLEQIAARPMAYKPGEKMVYSDWDYILMQLIIERITGQTLDRFVAERVFAPLGMRETMFTPPASLKGNIAATEVDSLPETNRGPLQGVVHDGNAWAIGGVSGHAGLFSSTRDLAAFVQMLMNGGKYNGMRILKPETVARWTTVQSALSSRALGWDTPSENSSAGEYFSARSFGHTGFTGTSIWADPEKGVFVVLLTNRVNSHYMTPAGKILRVRQAVGNAVQKAILDAPLKTP
jgi:CubicO group peptidase (beta-lactamase class C family)